MTVSNSQLALDIQNVVLGHQTFVNNQINWLASEEDTVTIVDPYTLVETTIITPYKLAQDFDNTVGNAASELAAATTLLADATALFNNAVDYEVTFSGHLVTVSGYLDDCENYATNAANSAANAAISETNASDSADAASTSASNAQTSEDNASTSANSANNSVLNIASLSSQISADAVTAADAAINATNAELNVASSVANMVIYESNAANSAADAETYKDSAEDARDLALSHADSASSNASDAENYRDTAEGYRDEALTYSNSAAASAASSIDPTEDVTITGSWNFENPIEIECKSVDNEAVILKLVASNGRSFSVLQPGNQTKPFIFTTANSFAFRVDALNVLEIKDNGTSKFNSDVKLTDNLDVEGEVKVSKFCMGNATTPVGTHNVGIDNVSGMSLSDTQAEINKLIVALAAVGVVFET